MPDNTFLLGIVLGAVAGVLAYWAGALTSGGALAAALVGATIFGFGGFAAALLLLFFFASSTLLTRFKAKHKQALKLGFSKGARRDAMQVCANGGVAMLCMLLHAWRGSTLALIGFIGAMAVATADTWGTEIGVLSKSQPRSILTGSPVIHGTSGGVTLLGTSASIIGAFAIGLIGYFVLGDWRSVALGTVAGVAGAIFDSLLGARWQVMYFCSHCEKPTESHPVHHCGSETHYQRGWRWLNNDGVNFLATCVGAGVSVLIAIVYIPG